MDRAGWSLRMKTLLLVLAIGATGFGVRFLLVHVPPGYEAPGMCELSTDFWRGDQINC